MAVFVFQVKNLVESYGDAPKDRELNLVLNGSVESFWGALWLELWLFLRFMENVAES